jgi:hypothetical protein
VSANCEVGSSPSVRQRQKGRKSPFASSTIKFLGSVSIRLRYSAAVSAQSGHQQSAVKRLLGPKTIRVGAGSIMLPDHGPYIIAEQFGTLACLFPGRIGLGLGRAPGTDQLTLLALRRTPQAAENFLQDVIGVQVFLAPAGPNQRIGAVPAAGRCHCGF